MKKQPSVQAIITGAVYNNHGRPRRFAINKNGKSALIYNHEKIYEAAITARGSQSDSSVIPISHSALDNVASAVQPEEKVEKDKAMIFSWQSNLGDIFAVGCTVEQHRALQPTSNTNAPKHLKGDGGSSYAFTYTPKGGYYLRRVDTDEQMLAQWEVYSDLAKAGKILFALRVPAPKLDIAP